ncbi:MAG: N-acetyltransferase [Flavisolibacter sp.]|nr:N-acetyltransferase [Flavisolibacter sp.]
MLQIRIATLSHLPAIVAIYNQAILDGFATADTEIFQTEDKRRWFEEHDAQHPIFVATFNEEVVGWLSLTAYRSGRKALSGVREVSYYVHACHQRKGIADALMHHVYTAAPQIGIQYLLAIVISKNTKSISFLSKHHFVEWGRLPSVVDYNGIICDHLYFGRKFF